MKKTNRELERSNLKQNQNFRLRKNDAQNETLFYQERLEIYKNFRIQPFCLTKLSKLLYLYIVRNIKFISYEGVIRI